MLVKGLLLTQLLCCGVVYGAGSVSVVGLFKDKALLMIDGQRKLLAIGAPAYAGVSVIGIEGEQVRLSVNGQAKILKLGENTSFATQYRPANNEQVTIARAENGMYFTSGTVNGIPVDFLVDTGATTVAMNATHARRVGIDYRSDGIPVRVSTASGTDLGYRVQLESVRVGGIELKNVIAVVMDSPHPPMILLGMSFLGQLEVQHSGPTMQLIKKW